MLVVDSQVHVADPGFGQWVEVSEDGIDPASRSTLSDRKHSHPELADLQGEMDRAGIDAAVLVPLFRRGSAALDNSTPIDVAKRHPNRFAVMARLDEGRQDTRALEQLVARPEVLGLRNEHPPEPRQPGDVPERRARAGRLRRDGFSRGLRWRSLT